MQYEIATYRNAEPITECPVDVWGHKGALRGAKEVCLTDRPAGDWWWNLNDGHLDVGPFPSEDAAFRDALATLARSPAADVSGVTYKGEPIQMADA